LSTNPFFPNNGNGAPTYDAVVGAGTANLNIDVAGYQGVTAVRSKSRCRAVCLIGIK
jgi:hypothetical protein